MTLTPGTRLGPYEVIVQIGVGGMGEVYRARDSRLVRDVALKVLPEGFGADADRVARLQREAQLLAAVNHPHIAGIYGLEESNGINALVLELVEGETLADRIARGPVRLDEALAIARQIADALEAAHEQGIVHRDLKPANIKVRTDGTVKVLDFGLAKLTTPDIGFTAGQLDVTASPTITSPARVTGMGTVLGTAAYMSPEQARGKAVDRRTDMWAFGCVLFEMLTGRRVFAGDEVTDVIALVITQQPDWTSLPDSTPDAIRTLLRRCLEKERARRLESASDARLEIEDARAPAIAPSRETTPRRYLVRERFAWSLAIVGAIGTAVLALRLSLIQPVAEPGPLRFTAAPAEGWALPTPDAAQDLSAAAAAVSPDGRSVAFVALNAGGTSQIWLRPLAELIAHPLSGTEGGHTPFWSPDSRELAFFADGKLKRLAISGGPPVTVAAINGRGGTWSREGVILVNPSSPSPIMRVSTAGGMPVPATTLLSAEADHRQPFFLPDGRHFIYVTAPTAASVVAYVAALDDSVNRTKLLTLQDGSNEVLYSRGRLLFMRGSTLMAQRFDPNRLALEGEPSPVADGIQVAGGYGLFSVSESGVLAYRAGAFEPGAQLTWFDRAGKPLGTVGEPGRIGDLALSPDASQVAFVNGSSNNWDLWIQELAGNVRRRVTFDSANEYFPVWSPDGKDIVFASNRSGNDRLYRNTATGGGSETVVLDGEGTNRAFSWSHDGAYLLYEFRPPANATEIWALPMLGERKPFLVVKAPLTLGQPKLSPNQRWVLYTSVETGRNEVFVTSFPKGEGKWQISTAGGQWARWSQNGHELVFLSPVNELMVAEVKGDGETFQVGAVHPLFRISPLIGRNFAYDVTPDGQRFLVNTILKEPTVTPLTIVTNWTADSK